MARRAHPNLTLLALLLTSTGLLCASEGLRPLARASLAALKAQQPQRVALLNQRIAAAKVTLGLGMGDELRPASQGTDAFGRTQVRYRQTYRGVDVYNGTVLGQVDSLGGLGTPLATVQPGIALDPVTLLDQAQLLAIVRRQLPATGRLLPMTARPLVFPTRYQDGLKVKRETGGGFTIDSDYSVGTPRKADPYRWAFQVSAIQVSAAGLRSTQFILDGQTGEILKKWDGAVHAEAPGTGNSQYNGTVALNTLQQADGLFTLRDTTRATKPYPDPMALAYPDWAGVGFQTVCYDFSAPDTITTSGTLPFTNATNTWGDASPFAWGQDVPLSTRGETAAADAHFATQATWDYYQNVLGRTGGIDGEGGSPISVMHMPASDNVSPYFNAAWMPDLFVMIYGDGAETGALTSLDVAAHEMSHGVMSFTANLRDGEAQGLNEANSDIHATMVKYYCWGADAAGGVVPATTTKGPGNTPAYLWTMGSQLSATGTPMRWLYQPSKDGISYDAWFDGIGLDDSHYSMGPGTRAFYFLSQGASGDATQATYSAFLPAGMAGIGNDAAIRIWYNGMAAHVTDQHADYHAIRAAMLASAAELHPATGAGASAEVAAVMNAFAAINVGGFAGGPEPIVVTFPAIPHSPFVYGKVLVLPALVATALPTPAVANAKDATVVWSLGGLSGLFPTGGRLEDGHFLAPMASFGQTWPIKATSKEDPRRFAANLVFGVSLDCDSDTETDACDLGALALAYGGVSVYPATNLYGGIHGADEICFAIFLEGFNNAFNN